MNGKVLFEPFVSESRMVWARWKDKYEEHREWWKKISRPIRTLCVKEFECLL